MDIVVEKANIEDAIGIINARRLAFRELYEKYKFCPAYDAMPEDVISLIDKMDIYKIVFHNKIIGSVFISKKEEREYELDTITIEPKYQNMGIGNKAIEYVEAQYTDALVWTLQTPENEIGNRHLYEKLGYRIVGIKTINEYLNLLQYRKEVTKTVLDESETRDIKVFYSALAEKTANEWYDIDILVPTIEEFLELLPKRPKVLDLGCGPGYESMRIEARNAEVVGIDICEENIKIARDRCPKCRFEVMDFRELDDRYGNFDGVFANASLIHINPIDLDKVMYNISRVLNNNGVLLVTVRDGDGTMDGSKIRENGIQLKRIIHLYSKQKITKTAEKYSLKFLKEGYMNMELLGYNWRCYILKKSHGCNLG